MKPICGYCNKCKKLTIIYETYMWVFNGCKKTNNYLRDLYVGIAYLKWFYVKDVGIAQCSF